jgi:hypothetical protein
VSASGRPEAGLGLGRRAESRHSRRTGMVVVGEAAAAAAAAGREDRLHSVNCCLSR